MINNALAHYNLAAIHQNSKHLNKAIKHYRRAISLNPSFIPAITNLGLCLRNKGNFDEAIDLYLQTLNVSPNNPDIHLNLGNLYYETHRFQLALNHYLLVKKLAPTNINVLINLGMIYSMIGQYRLAQTNLRQAIKLDPQNPILHFRLGHVYFDNNQYPKAIACYQKVIEIDPEYQFAQSSLYIAKRRICDWKNLDPINHYLNISHNEDPWSSLVRSEDPQTNLSAAKNWSQKLKDSITNLKLQFRPSLPHIHPQTSKIRLGYLSDNFSSQPAGYMALDLFRHHQHQNFITYAYVYGRNDNSACRKNLKKTADNFLDINAISDLEVAKQIQADQIDILIDLSGYTVGNRLQICALKPAPIQISWPEVLSTTGADFFDYSIVDQTLVPKSEQNTFTEKLIYLSGCSYLRQYPPLQHLSVPTRKKFNLPDSDFVFGVFHQMYKIDPTVWQIWMNILKAVPQSVLWLWQQNITGAQNLCRYAKQSGINPKRLIFAPSMSPKSFLTRLPLADLALDTFIYGGGITSYQTLAAGVPLITLYGSHMASRNTSDLLLKTKLPQLVTHSPKEYQDLAIKLANNPALLAKIKVKLTHHALQSTLFDTNETITNLEKTYGSLCRNR